MKKKYVIIGYFGLWVIYVGLFIIFEKYYDHSISLGAFVYVIYGVILGSFMNRVMKK